MPRELHFRLTISPDEAIKYYKGNASAVIAMAETGQRIQFPARHIRPSINSQGVHGYFSIEFDEENKLIALKRIS